MTNIGWEFYGVKFSMFLTMFATLAMFVCVWFGARKSDYCDRVDLMAGDEGEE